MTDNYWVLFNYNLLLRNFILQNRVVSHEELNEYKVELQVNSKDYKSYKLRI